MPKMTGTSDAGQTALRQHKCLQGWKYTANLANTWPIFNGIIAKIQSFQVVIWLFQNVRRFFNAMRFGLMAAFRYAFHSDWHICISVVA